jgi:hypothetical protein
MKIQLPLTPYPDTDVNDYLNVGLVIFNYFLCILGYRRAHSNFRTILVCRCFGQFGACNSACKRTDFFDKAYQFILHGTEGRHHDC